MSGHGGSPGFRDRSRSRTPDRGPRRAQRRAARAARRNERALALAYGRMLHVEKLGKQRLLRGILRAWAQLPGRRAARAARRRARAKELAYGRMLLKETRVHQQLLAASFARLALLPQVRLQVREWLAHIGRGRMQRARDLVRTALRGWFRITRRVSFKSGVTLVPACAPLPACDVEVLWRAAAEPTSCNRCEEPLHAARGFLVATTLGRIEERPAFAKGELFCAECMALAASGHAMFSAPAA